MCLYFVFLLSSYIFDVGQHFFLFSFVVALGLCCCQGLSLLAVSGGYSLVAAHGILIAVAPLVAEHMLQGAQASVVAARGF